MMRARFWWSLIAVAASLSIGPTSARSLEEKRFCLTPFVGWTMCERRFSSVSGTILSADAHQLVVATARGDRVVVTLESRTIGLWDGASPTNGALGNFVPSLRDVARNAGPLVTRPPELLLWTSSSALILPVLGLFVIGTAGAVAVGRRISTVFT